MKQSLVELVSVIKQHLEEHGETPPTENGVRKWLTRQGYKKPEIDEAFKLMQHSFGVAVQPPTRNPASVRHLSSYETYKLSREAREALVRLELYDLIEPFELEILLERLAQIDGEAGIEDLDYLLSWMMCATRNTESQQTIYNVLEGTEGTLH